MLVPVNLLLGQRRVQPSLIQPGYPGHLPHKPPQQLTSPCPQHWDNTWCYPCWWWHAAGQIRSSQTEAASHNSVACLGPAKIYCCYVYFAVTMGSSHWCCQQSWPASQGRRGLQYNEHRQTHLAGILFQRGGLDLLEFLFLAFMPSYMHRIFWGMPACSCLIFFFLFAFNPPIQMYEMHGWSCGCGGPGVVGEEW